MTATQFPFDVTVRNTEGHTMPLTIKVAVNKDQQAHAILKYLRSVQAKNDLMNSWVKENAAGYGMEVVGGPRPVFETANDRNTPVVAYEQDFKLTRSI